MQQKSKHTFSKSKMNKDLDARLVNAGEYRDGVNVSVSRSEGDDVGALENILGNNFLDNLQNIHTGTGGGIDPYKGVSPVEVIGWNIQENTDSIYIFITNYQDNSSDGISNTTSPNSIHRIIHFNTQSKTSQVIVEGSFLNFSINSPILHTNLLENLLFWTDNRNQPRKINVDTAKADPSYYFNEDHISVAKYFPWNSIKILDTLSATGKVVSKTDTINGVTWPNGYNAWRSILVLKDDTSADTINFLEGNIGAKGYAIDKFGNRWELTVAWYQKDYDDNTTSTGQILPDYGAGYIGSGRPLVFIDREMAPPLEPHGFIIGDEYQLFFTGTTQKDVSSQWLEESKSKVQITGFGDITLGYSANSLLYNFIGNGDDYCAPLYKYATRSDKNGLSVPEYGEAVTAVACPTFTYDQFLSVPPTSNLIQYGLIKHPHIPNNINYYIAHKAINPVNPLATGKNWFEILNEDGVGVNASEIGLVINDIITIYWPNPNFNPNFSGDEKFLEDKFVRFSYRFLYDDGEYSVIAPFTQPIFIPKQKGYFEKRVGSIKAFSQDDNYFIGQEEEAGQNTIVDFFVNEVSSVNLKIPTEFPVNQLKNILKVKEIDILYKESTELALKVVKTIDINDTTIVTNNSYSLLYEYQSEKPIKVLKSSEISRVYDNVPVRAAAQESSGNRIIYGNFYDRHTSPLTLDYLVGAGNKFTLSDIQTSNSNISYPNHTLKQNRTYQVGIILSDRYGRSSDVILSSFVGNAVEIDLYKELIFDHGGMPSKLYKFGGSTIYNPYFTSVTEPFISTVPSTDINRPLHLDAGIWSWPGDSLKVLFSNTIPSTISTNAGYPGLYDEWITNLQVLNYVSPGILEIDPLVGVISTIKPGMKVTWTNAGGITFVNTIISVNFNGPQYFITVNPVVPWDALATAPQIGDSLRISIKETLGWYSYKVVVKQQEQEYYNVYLASLLNGNPVVKPFNLALDAAIIGATRITVDPSMADPRTFLLLEGMNFTVTGVPNIEHTITNILNNDQFDITPPLVSAIGAGYNPMFTTKSTKNSINISTLLTDNANKVPPGLVETTPVQQQYSTSQTRLIPRVAVAPEFNPIIPAGPYISYSPNINGPIFPGKESAKVNALGNFTSLFVDGSYAGMWQADTDPTAMIVQNKWKLGVFSEEAKPDTSNLAKDQLMFSCYETTPVKSELEIFYETSTSGLVSELNETIATGLSIPYRLAIYDPANPKAEVGTVNWSESLERFTSPTILKFQFLDAQDNPLLYDAPFPGGSIVNFNYLNETFVNGAYAGFSAPPNTGSNTYQIEESPIPAEQVLGVYYLKLRIWGGGNYHREDDDFNNIQIDISIDVKIFGGASTYQLNYPFQIQTYIENAAPLDDTSPFWVSPPGPGFPTMLNINQPGILFEVNNNHGDLLFVEDEFGSIYPALTKTYNGCYPFARNKIIPPKFAGVNELVYDIYIETFFGSGIYDKLSDIPTISGLSLISVIAPDDGGEYVQLNIGDVIDTATPGVFSKGIAIGATDKNGLGLTTYVSKLGIDIVY